ncbi:MAG: lactate utilization protein [Aminivibrio sp.]|jgi:L-lactate utilization protein LutB
MNDFTPWHNETLGKKVVEALKKNGFEAEYCATSAEAAEKILALVPEGASVGFGGSWTIMSMGIKDKLAEGGHELFDHNAPGLSNEERQEMRKKQLSCDVFLSGTNALTLDGRLVNTDGNGNRVAAMIFGPGKVIVATGANKIVRDLDAAEERRQMVSAPINNKRIGLPNPCVQTGMCMDCQTETRICNVTTVISKRPKFTPFHVFVIGEDLGF